MVKQLLLLLPFSLVASELQCSLKLLEGNDYYTVTQPSSNLKAKLIFPTSAYLLDLAYIKNSGNISYTLNGAFPVYDNGSYGEDFDWDNGQPTYYSSSKDRLETFYQIGAAIDYRLSKAFTVGIAIEAQRTLHQWFDVEQVDLSTNAVSATDGEVLRYAQQYINTVISLGYERHNKYSIYAVKLDLGYQVHEAKDEHLLRYFYTEQRNEGLSLGLQVTGGYQITNRLALLISYRLRYFEDSDSIMDYYYESTDERYQSLPSTYLSVNQTTAFTISYHF